MRLTSWNVSVRVVDLVVGRLLSKSNIFLKPTNQLSVFADHEDAQMAMLYRYNRIGGCIWKCITGTYGGTPVAVKRITINNKKEKEIDLQEVKALM